jgi:hypothetical protein
MKSGTHPIECLQGVLGNPAVVLMSELRERTGHAEHPLSVKSWLSDRNHMGIARYEVRIAATTTLEPGRRHRQTARTLRAPKHSSHGDQDGSNHRFEVPAFSNLCRR